MNRKQWALSLCGAAAIACGGSACAADLEVKPSADLRLRYETVDQGGLARNAAALTLRARPGLEAARGQWSVLVEGEGTIAIADEYNDGTNGRTVFPLIVDPRNIELNRAQIRYADGKGGSGTFGRQRIEIGDQRFVGSSGFRQNEQTYDSVRLQWAQPKGLVADFVYSWSVRTVNGKHGFGARQQAVAGDNLFGMLGHATPLGTIAGFAYLVDQDEALVQGFRLSSQTYGLRFSGSRALSKSTKLAYAASWARQSDYHRNPNHYSADYLLAEATLTANAFIGTLGYEVLGADKGLPLTSVQTPLGSLFKFQGWADKFTTTPPNGIRDLYGTLGYGWKELGPADTVGLSATYHRFDSDRQAQHYGNEVDLLASARRGRYMLTARYARYRADGFATDTDKLWLSLDWILGIPVSAVRAVRKPTDRSR